MLPFLGESVFTHNEIRTNCHGKKFALRLVLKEKLMGNKEEAYYTLS